MARRTIILSVAMLVIVCFAASILSAAENTLTPAEKAAGWKLLFDGQTLNGWKSTGTADNWAVDNGAIVNTQKGSGYLATVDNSYKNFTLSLEFLMEKDCNSGIFFHWTNLNDPVQTGIEIQVLDSSGKTKVDKHDCGAVYDCMEPMVNATKPAGEWNKIAITCKDNLIWIDMNGKRIIYMDSNRWTTPHHNPDGTPNKFDTAYKDMAQPGYIGFQDHGHKVWYRNIKIRQF
jgi:hypothetical protein